MATCKDPLTYTSVPKQCADNQLLKVKFSDQKVDTNGSLQADSTISRIVVRSCLDSLAKLKLETFDGDPIHWSDWISMFQAIIDDTDISCNA